jgi:hypothetical protein
MESVEIVEYEPLVRGPRGMQGLQGDRGLQGVEGKDGYIGADGKDGKDGVQGVRGEAGHPGVKGKDGKDGDRGPKGLSGHTGPKGAHGKKGPKGEVGRAGTDTDIRNLSDRDIAFLKDNVVGRVVDDILINDNDEKTTFTVAYTRGKSKIFEVLKPRPGVVRVSGGTSTTNITEEVLSPEDSENLETIADNSVSSLAKLTEMFLTQREQSKEQALEIKLIKTHLASISGEKLTEKDI